MKELKLCPVFTEFADIKKYVSFLFCADNFPLFTLLINTFHTKHLSLLDCKIYPRNSVSKVSQTLVVIIPLATWCLAWLLWHSNVSQIGRESSEKTLSSQGLFYHVQQHFKHWIWRPALTHSAKIKCWCVLASFILLKQQDSTL